MSPCDGCLKRMSDPKGLFSMRFVGKPNGVFLRGAPGNYVHGQIYNQPYRMSKFKFWQLEEEIPVLVAPKPNEDDNVFEESVFIPDDEEEVVVIPEVEEVVPTPDEEAATVEMVPVNLESGDGNPYNPNAPAILEPYAVFNTGTGRTTPYVAPEITTTAPIGEYEVTLSTQEPEEEKLDRDELMRVLDEAGVEYKKGVRTTTLKKMVDELVSKE